MSGRPGQGQYDATAETGSLIVNIKNRVANRGPLKGQRHPYVYELVLALQHMGWRWIETYIWAKPNAVPGRFGPRTKPGCTEFARSRRLAIHVKGLLTWENGGVRRHIRHETGGTFSEESIARIGPGEGGLR